MFQVKCEQNQKTFGHCGSGRISGFAWARQEHLYCGFLAKVKQMWTVLWQFIFWGAILDRQGLQVAAPADLRNKKIEHFSLLLLQGFLVKAQDQESQDCCDVPDCYYPKFYTKESRVANNTVCAWEWQSIKSSAENIYLILGPESGKYLVVEKKVHHLQKKDHCQWTLVRGKNPEWIFFILLATCWNHLSSYQPRASIWFQRNGKSDQSLETVYPRQKWFQFERHNIGNMRWSVTSRILQIWAYKSEAALATNWIKDGPWRVETSEPCIRQYDRPGCAQSTEEYNCRCTIRC